MVSRQNLQNLEPPRPAQHLSHISTINMFTLIKKPAQHLSHISTTINMFTVIKEVLSLENGNRPGIPGIFDNNQMLIRVNTHISKLNFLFGHLK